MLINLYLYLQTSDMKLWNLSEGKPRVSQNKTEREPCLHAEVGTI